jgi:hypothetical protein
MALCQNGLVADSMACFRRMPSWSMGARRHRRVRPPHKMQHDREQREYLNVLGAMAHDVAADRRD